MAGTKPREVEKWWGVRRGVVFSCLLVIVASSRAIIRPRTETARAANFSSEGIVSTGVLVRFVFSIIKRPPKMLPQAKRIRGRITAGLFSLIGERGRNRGVPMETKKMTRRL